MRRDVCYFFTADVKSVYNAYVAAATNAQFRRECKQEPYHTLGFGLNFSMKYNMNGGACTLHFIPYENGTAVDIRFTIAQAAGARYGRYAEDLTNAAAAVLGKESRSITIPIEMFLDPNNQVSAASYAAPAASAAPVQPAAAAYQAPAAPAAERFCPNCGNAVSADAVFCSRCGTKQAPPARYCTRCGLKVSQDALFCTQCGNKL